MDAFAGDSVPMHLVTREPFALYGRRLAPAGILAPQITNQYADLRPVVRAAASALGLHAVVVSAHGQRFPLCDSTWVLLSQQASRFETPAFAKSHPLTAAPVIWTGDHADLLPVLKR